MALTLIPTPYVTPVGSDPGWVPGYVPSAVEWNDWWSRKVDVDDASLVGGPFLSLAGGTMTGPVYLPITAPALPEEAVNKAYVDSLTFATGPFMPQTGGTFTGPVVFNAKVTLAANPVDPLDPATKGYVDASTGVANNALAVANAAVRRSGDTMTGLLTLSAHPVNPMNAATMGYADTKLWLGGGTITGGLTVNVDLIIGRDLYVNNRLLISPFGGWEWSFSTDTSGNHVQQYRGQWYDIWSSANGVRTWVGGNVSLMSLDGSGNLYVKAGLSALSFTSNYIRSNGDMNVQGNMGVAGSLSAAAFAVNGGYTLFNNGAQQVTQHTAGWYEYWNNSGGWRGWVSNNTEVMSLDPSGSLSVINVINGYYLHSNTSVVATQGIGAIDGQMWMSAGGLGRIMQFAPSWYWEWSSADGTLSWVANFPAVNFWTMRTGDRFCFNNLGPVGGSYFSIQSDERAKTDIVPAKYGLSEIMALEPIEFTRINDGSKREIGFSAQQVRGVIPEAVNPFGATLPDGSGGIDTDNPSLGIDTTPVIAALVNAVKELTARLTEQEGRA